MRRSCVIMLSVALLLGAGAGIARADDASLGRSGETVFPIGEPVVRMAAEEVLLKVAPRRTDVALTFTFANAGPAKSVLMGFPLAEQHEGRGHPELNQFHTDVDGVATPVKQEPARDGDRYPGWMTWTVPFRESQTRVVQNSYWGTNSYWSDGTVAAGYILKTGAVWQGTIGRALVRAKLDGLLPSDLGVAAPADFRWDGDDLVWEWREFEPQHDIALRWNMRFGGLSDLALRAAEAATPSEAVAILKANPTEAGLTLARYQYLAGDKAGAVSAVKSALAAGTHTPFVAYVAVKEGLLPAADALKWPDLGPVMLRWLQDRAGVAGAPPAVPAFRLVDALNLEITLADPDGDIADWGVKVWLQPNEQLTPIATGPAEDSWSEFPSAKLTQHIQLPNDHDSKELWARAWVADGKGHRQDTGLVKLALPGAPAPAPQPAPPVEAKAPAPHLPWWILAAVGALLVAGLGIKVLHKRR